MATPDSLTRKELPKAETLAALAWDIRIFAYEGVINVTFEPESTSTQHSVTLPVVVSNADERKRSVPFGGASSFRRTPGAERLAVKHTRGWVDGGGGAEGAAA